MGKVTSIKIWQVKWGAKPKAKPILIDKIKFVEILEIKKKIVI
jgi:hypothetical protein